MIPDLLSSISSGNEFLEAVGDEVEGDVELDFPALEVDLGLGADLLDLVTEGEAGDEVWLTAGDFFGAGAGGGVGGLQGGAGAGAGSGVGGGGSGVGDLEHGSEEVVRVQFSVFREEEESEMVVRARRARVRARRVVRWKVALETGSPICSET
jgi:hypothetical protein